MSKYTTDTCLSPNDFDKVLDTVDRGDFTIHQVYTKGPTETIQCKVCESIEFIVGIDDHFTAIKCKKCNYEICIHEG